MNKKLSLLIIFSLIIRLGIGYFQFSGDVKNHLVWGSSFLENPIGLYTRHFSGFNDVNYPPLAIILFGLSIAFYNLILWCISLLNSNLSIFPSFIVPLFQSENMSMLFLKIPGILSDIGIGYLLYHFVANKKKSLLLPALYLLNPATIYISSVWGQIEPITSFFLLLSLYLGLSSNKKTYSSLVFALAVLTKQTALWFTPFFLILWWKELGFSKKLFQSLLSSVAIFFVFYLPFGLLPTSAVSSFFATLSGSSTLVSDAAWNIWYFIFPGRVEDSIILGFVSVRIFSIILLVISLLYIIYQLIKKYSISNIFYYLSIWSLLVFFVQTRVHERHLAPAILFLLVGCIFSKRYFIPYLIFSIYHFLNLYLTLGLPFI